MTELTESPPTPPPARGARWRWAVLFLFVPTLALADTLLQEPRAAEVPVDGVRRADLVSTFGAPRDGGKRSHRGADIFAPRGTPVVSATDGYVMKVGTNSLGGRVVTVLGPGPALYYYAHLDDWDPSIRPGRRVDAGARLGWVGNTGNARTTPSHLHFGLYRVGWLGTRAVDPVPWLRQASPPSRSGRR